MTSSSPKDDTPKSCCPTNIKPALNDYRGVGQRVSLRKDYGLDATLLDYDMYVTGTSTTSKHVILLAYDIFGWTCKVEQVADRLAHDMDCLVVVPDFFRGDPWPITNIPVTQAGAFPQGVEPGEGLEVLYGWIMQHPNLITNRISEITAIKQYFVQNYGITKFGMTGFCWGGKVAFVAAAATTRNGAPLLDAVATCHGALLEKEDIEAVVRMGTVPICLLDSKDEPELHRTVFQPLILEANNNKDTKKGDDATKTTQNVYKYFETMHHGWMGTRGTESVTDFEKEEVQQRWQEAMSDLVAFFTQAFASK